MPTNRIALPRKLLAVFCLIFCFLFSEAQNEAAKWHFGKYAALDFMTNPVTSYTGSPMYAFEGSASMADAAGNLLFYSDGLTVWNRLHQVMANGTGLNGGISTVQAALAVKQPGNVNSWILFTLDSQGGANGLQYSVIDMNLAAGNGSVTAKNIPVATPCTEMLTGAVHCNGTDIWVVAHGYNSGNFMAYLVTAAGVNTTAVVSSIGGVIDSTGQGALRISPNGRKLAANWYNAPQAVLTLYDFDNTTGVVSNSLSLASQEIANYISCEFSPDGTKLYSSYIKNNPFPGVRQIKQWNLCAANPAAILASETIVCSIVSLSSYYGALLNAPDGRIYAAVHQSLSPGVINNPNLAGVACNCTTAPISLNSATMGIGLPNFVCSIFRKPAPFTYTISPTECQKVAFSAPPPSSFAVTCNAATPPATSYLWLFGDPASGNNSSTQTQVTHSFSAGGTYTVKLVSFAPCNTDTSTQIIYIAPQPVLTVSGNTLVCSGSATTLQATGANTYSWSTQQSGSIVTVIPASGGSIQVVGTNTTNGCKSDASITLSLQPLPQLGLTGPSHICMGSTGSYTVSGTDNYAWSTGSLTNVVTLSPTISTVYTVTGTSTLTGCSSSRTLNVLVVYCVGEEEQSLPEDLKVYPNPFSEELILETDATGDLTLYDAKGTIVLKQRLAKGSNVIVTESLRSGAYQAVIDYGKKKVAVKLICGER